jgi:outer membrane immunogenic protein
MSLMRRVITTLAVAGAIAVCAQAARAADLPIMPTKAPPPVALFDWTGFYIGANVGYGWADADLTVGGVTATDKLKGIVGGGQLGYNRQMGNWIFGIEIDGQGTDEHSTTTIPGASLTNSLPWFMTFRGRVGYAIAPTWMIYATGGAAVVDFKSQLVVGGLGTATTETTRAGWTAGAGIEAAINRDWSWKVEYLHIDTGTFNTTLFGVVPTSLRVTDDITRVGINYRY